MQHTCAGELDFVSRDLLVFAQELNVLIIDFLSENN